MNLSSLKEDDAKRVGCRTLVDVVEHRVEHDGESMGYRFLSSSGEEESELTYGQLRERIVRMASHLAEYTSVGDRVLLLLPPGLDYVAAVFACQYAGVVAVPAYPPNPRRADSRVAGIAADSGARVAIVATSLHERLDQVVATTPSLAEVTWLDASALCSTPVAERIRPGKPDALAFLQYTSGSTGSPRGVMLPQSAVVHNLGVIHRALRQHDGDESCFWIPPYHDMGLVGAILGPLYSHVPITLMSPSTFSQRPVRWLEAMSRYRATTSGAPNFAYDLCVDRTTEAERASLDLSRWRVAINGAEPVRPETMERFVQAFAPHGFRREAFLPCYGLAETTLFAAGVSQSRAPMMLTLDRDALEARRLTESTGERAARLVSVGPPADSLEISIVKPETCEPCAANEVGEIWIAGESVASGYWGREAESAAVFGARLPGCDRRYLRTGDLGALHDGELVVTGRLKDLVIVGGRNVYPQDIERAAEGSHPNIRSGAVTAFSTGTSGGERVVIVAEVARHHRPDGDVALTGAVRKAVADTLGITVDDVVLIRQGTLPKTSSGKLQRRRTRELYESRELAFLTPATTARRARAETVPSSSAERADRVRAWLREYARGSLDSHGMNERRELPADVRQELAAHGLFGLQVPLEMGGLALASADILRVIEQLASIDLTLATFVGGHNSLGVRPLLAHATPAVRNAFVPSMARGECIGALAVTEPAAGSNPWAMEALAIPVDGGWRLHGVKSWIGSAGIAGVFNVFARVPGDDGGITAFTVRAGTPGLRVGAAALTLGMRGMLQNAVHLDGVFVSEGSVIGHVGGGIDVALDTFLHARFGVAAMALGALKRALQLAHRYASRRRIATGVLLDHPVTRAKLGEMAASAAALDAYLSTMAESLDAGLTVPEDAFIVCKTAAPELLWSAVDDAMQLLGGRGYMESNPLAPLFRDARLLRIFEGPTEPLLVHLGARTMRGDAEQHAWLATALKSPDIAERIGVAARAASGRSTESTTTAERAALHQWNAFQLGKAVTEGAMLAAAREAAARGTAGADLAITTFQRRFDAVLKQCGADDAHRTNTRARAAISAAASWADSSIGDVEQRSNLELDPLLVSDWTEPSRNGSAAHVGKHADERRSARVAAGVSLPFILEWLTDEFQLAAGTAAGDTSLRDLGLDSLAATRLVAALESHLARRVDASLLWRSATIAEFAAAADGMGGDHPSVPLASHHPQADALAFGQWPEYRTLRGRLAEASSEGSSNPYFAVHEGISGATARVDGRELLNFANYNYLGLSGHPAVRDAAQDAIERYGTSVSASRVASGERPLHAELERAIAQFIGLEDALVFVGGHATNVATLSHLFGPGDLVLCDALIHNSALQGAAFSGARWVTFPHNDWAACDAMLAEMRSRHRRAVVVIEGAYSADGDVPELRHFVNVKQRHGAMLMVDEAHSLGVLGRTGRGIAESAGVHPAAIDISMGTLSKSLASCGGYIAGSKELVEYLKYTAPGFVYSVGITPPNAAAALAALRVLESEPERVVRVRENASRFARYAHEAGLDTGKSGGSAVIPVIVGDSLRAVRVSQTLFQRGINVQPMISPAVGNEEARLRFFVSSEHTDEQLRAAVRATAQALAAEPSRASDLSLALTP